MSAFCHAVVMTCGNPPNTYPPFLLRPRLRPLLLCLMFHNKLLWRLDISPELVEDRGFLDGLRDLISDANPTVVSNAVAALNEIAETSGKDVMLVTASVLQKLLAALNECTEWGQVFILDSLSKYQASDAREAEGII